MKSDLQIRWHGQIQCWSIALSSVLLAIGAQAATEDNLHKAFDVSPGGKLVMDVRVGGIEVTGTKESGVTIDVIRKVTVRDSEGNRDEDKEKELLLQNEVTFRNEGNTVAVEMAHNKHSAFQIHGSINLDFRFVIGVPEKFNVDLKTSGGGIAVASLHGDVKTETSGGGFKFTNVRGPIHGHTSGGGIQVKDCEGHISIETSGGSIHIVDHKGDISAHTSGGGIKIERVEGEVDAETSGGSIAASLQPPVAHDWRLSTSGGGITVRLPETAKLDVDAETSAGRVHSELPVTLTGKEERSRLKGKLNGGGASLVLRTSAGSIYLRKLGEEEHASAETE